MNEQGLYPGIQRYVERSAAFDAAAAAPTTPNEVREHYRARCRAFDPPPRSDVTVTDVLAPGKAGHVPLRVCAPRTTDGRPGAIVYFHGGGWVMGDLDTHERLTAELAHLSQAVVVAVDYRLAPEAPYPAAFDDAFAATLFAASHGEGLGFDARRLVVAGDSAGGNLAAAVALAARDRGGPRLCGQALIYPCLDPDLSSASAKANAHAPVLSRDAMIDYWRAYIGPQRQTQDPLAAPLRARDLTGLPPAIVTTAEHDPLVDDGRVYAERLRAAGVEVELRPGPRLVHGYLRAVFMCEEAATELAFIARACARMLAV